MFKLTAQAVGGPYTPPTVSPTLRLEVLNLATRLIPDSLRTGQDLCCLQIQE
jgi:hypothetical protein